MYRTHFGGFLHRKRAEQRISKRAFAIKAGLDPAYYARIERGNVAPPQERVLTKIAEALGISPGWSPEWEELVHVAELSRGEIPSEVLDDATLGPLMPAFFARLREHKGKTSEELFELFRSIVLEPPSSDEEQER